MTNAQLQLEAGRHCPAAAMLRALRRQVETFAGAGILTDTEAAALLDGVDRVLGDNQFVAATVSAGGRHTCALTPDGTAYCWGSNEFGGLGDGSSQDRLRPVPVATSLRFQAIATGRDFTCAVSVAGQAYCWGVNHRGQLSDGTMSDSWTPVAVQSAIPFQSIVARSAV